MNTTLSSFSKNLILKFVQAYIYSSECWIERFLFDFPRNRNKPSGGVGDDKKSRWLSLLLIILRINPDKSNSDFVLIPLASKSEGNVRQSA